MKLMDKFRQMMVGRYGTDQLNIALIVAYFIVSILAGMFRSSIVMFVSYIFFALCIYRMFSKNLNKRYQENMKFLQVYNPIKRKFDVKRTQYKDKTHRYYRCKNCGQTIRVPMGKGKIAITCPKCKKEFIKRT